jgi:hypothetical protein
MVRIRDQRWLGIWDVNALAIKANEDAEFLLMEIPMQYYYYG